MVAVALAGENLMVAWPPALRVAGVTSLISAAKTAETRAAPAKTVKRMMNVVVIVVVEVN